ncbi:hypothetical protein ACQY0O_000958 [Thecaphora frezii]
MSAAAAQVEKPTELGGADLAPLAVIPGADDADAVAAAPEDLQVAAATVGAGAIVAAVEEDAVMTTTGGGENRQRVISTPRRISANILGGESRQGYAPDRDCNASPGVLSLEMMAETDSSGSATGSSLPSTEPSTTPSETSSGNGYHKRLKLAARRPKKSKHLQLPHPLGVKPLGNAFFSEHNSRATTLGRLSSLDDDLLVHLLSLFGDDAATLTRIEATSRGLYTFVNSTNSLWRDCFLQRFEGKLKRWCGSWKRTYAWHHKLERLVGEGQSGDGFDGSNLVLLEPPNPPIRTPHIFSDTLFHPFRLSLAPIDHFLAVEADHIPIDHIDVGKPGAVARFREKHAEANVPAIIEGAMSVQDWPCRQWTLETLAMRWPNRFFQCEAIRCRLPTYLGYAKSIEALCEQAQKDEEEQAPRRSKSCSPLSSPSSDASGDHKQLHQQPVRASSIAHSIASPHSCQEEAEPSFDPHAIPDESPFYLFDATFADDPHASLEWRVPKIFHQISAEMPDLSGHTAGVRSDLFSLLGPLRPDHRWIIAGPSRSGSGWHKDPNGTSAWNAVLTGRKAWMMLPPHVTPPGVYVSADEAEITAPLSIAEWLIGFAEETRKTYGPSAARPGDRVLLEVVCEAGEVLYVPSGWWHLVVNLEESVALTQNFVSPPELGVVLDFMKNKADQLSGFKKSSAAQCAFAPGRQPGSLPAAMTANGNGFGNRNGNDDEAEEEGEDGAGFGVFELFCDRLGKFDKELLASGLATMAEIEAQREANSRSGRTCSHIVRGRAEGSDTTVTRGETLWDKLKKPCVAIAGEQDAEMAPAADAPAATDQTADVQATTAATAAGADTFSLGAQLADEELEEVPW